MEIACVNVSNKRKLKAQFQLENQQLLLKDHFCLLPQYPTCMLSTNFCEYACLYQSSYYHKYRVNPLHIEYIAWYIIMFEATHYKLLLHYYNVVMSELVTDQCSLSHA